jgi:hypothetical protein
MPTFKIELLGSHIAHLSEGIEQLVKELPAIIGQEAVTFAQAQIKQQGTIRGASTTPWPSRREGSPRQKPSCIT